MTTTEVIASGREDQIGAHEFIRANSGVVERLGSWDVTTTEVIASGREDQLGAHEFIRANSGVVERLGSWDATTTEVIVSGREKRGASCVLKYARQVGGDSDCSFGFHLHLWLRS